MMKRTVCRHGEINLDAVTLIDGDHSIELLNVGAVTTDWRFRDHRLVLGYANKEQYITNPIYAGAIVGRVANRIAGGQFVLDGQTFHLSQNEPPNTLHGGAGGISHKVWNMELNSQTNQVLFQLHSPDGDQGFPGVVDFQVLVTLQNGRLLYDMAATPDRPTPISMAQHNYYNLAGGGPIWDHHFELDATAVTLTDHAGIPTGQVTPLNGDWLDFRKSSRIGARDVEKRGIDLNYILAGSGTRKIATLSAAGQCQMDVVSNLDAVQFYTGGHIPSGLELSNGTISQPFSGLCIEPQGVPNAVNQTDFPPIICTPDRPYSQRLELRVSDFA